MSRLGWVGSLVLLLACRDPGDLIEPTAVGSPPAPQFSIVVFGVTDLGSPLGGDIGRARAVNDLGEVVGESSRSPGGLLEAHAFHWINGAVRDLGTLVGHDHSIALDVNAWGQAVGNSSAILGPPHATSWSTGPAEPLSLLAVGTLETLLGQSAVAINDLGEIVGRAFVSTEFGLVTRGVYWPDKDAAEPQALQHLGGVDTEPNDINDLGQIVGTSRDLSGTFRPVFWAHPNAAPQTLLPLPGSADLVGFAHAINELGQIVGSGTTATGEHHALIWPNHDAIPVDLGTFGGGPNSAARDINELGQIVGQVTAPSAILKAVMWLPEPASAPSYRVFPLGGEPGSLAFSVNNTGLAAGETSSQATLWSIPVLAPVEVTPLPIKLDGKGYVQVVVQTNPWFNATTVEPGSLTLGNDDGLETPIARKKKLTPRASLIDADRDGDADLVAEFEEKLLRSNGDLSVGSTSLTLLGRLWNGKPVRGMGGVTVQ